MDRELVIWAGLVLGHVVEYLPDLIVVELPSGNIEVVEADTVTVIDENSLKH